MERNIKLIVAYDGTHYHGFQRQTNALSIQAVLESQLPKVCGHEVTVFGAARTDSGVHAYGQVINFFTTGRIPTERIPLAMKGLLPADIVVKKAEEEDYTFHARYSAKSKIYLYRIYNDLLPDPFLHKYAWHIMTQLDSEKIAAAGRILEGEHDFSAFQAAGSAIVNPVRTLYSVSVNQKGPLLELAFFGNGFLYHMVRNIVGTLVGVGLGRTSLRKMEQILASGDRKQAGMTAPAQGLFLKQVNYA